MYMASSQFKVLVGVRLDAKSMSNLVRQINGTRIDLRFNSKEVLNELTQIRTAINNIGSGGGGGNKAMNDMSKQAREINSQFSRLLATEREMSSVRMRIEGLDKASSEARILIGYYNQLETRSAKLQSALKITSTSKGMLSTAQFEKLNDVMTKTGTNAVLAQDKIERMFSAMVGGGAAASKMSKIELSLSKISSQSDRTKVSVQMLKNAYDQLSRAKTPNEKASAMNAFNTAYKTASHYIQENISKEKQLAAVKKQSTAAAREYNAAVRLDYNRANLRSTIDLWLKNNSAIKGNSADAKRLYAEIRKIQTELKSCDAVGLNNLRTRFSTVTKEAQRLGVATMSLGDRLRKQMQRYSAYFSIASVFMYGTMAIRNMARAVLEVDTAMTGLLRVTEMTASETDIMFDKMIDSAKEYGRTLTDTINATADWVRAGFDENTALGLAEKTAMYQNVSDLDYKEASENLLTSFNGFKEQLLAAYGGSEVEAVGHIVDVLNELDNKFSVTSAGLGEGLARSASALMLAGNTFEEAII